jgi:hypothetical protein
LYSTPEMSASSRSTIFSLRSKKWKDSGELQTYAGPAYDDLPMSPRLPVNVPLIVPPSQLDSRAESSQARYGGVSEYMLDGDENSDSYSVKSEPRNGYGSHQYGSLKGGSNSGFSLGGGGGGVNGPRPLPPRSGSAEKMNDNTKSSASGHDSPQVIFPTLSRRGNISDVTRNYTRNERPRTMDLRGLGPQMHLEDLILLVARCHHLHSAETVQGQILSITGS